VVFNDLGYEFTPTTGSQVTSNAPTAIGTVALSGGVAKLVVPAGFAAGVHQIVADYQGDSNFTASSPALGGKFPFSQVASDNTQTLAGSAVTPNPSVGATITFTTFVKPGSNPTGTGAVGFGGTAGPALIVYTDITNPASPVVLGSRATSPFGDGRSRFTISSATLGLGMHTVTATYNGDDDFGALPLMKQAVGTLTSAGTTATVSLTGHGYSTGDLVTIAGATPAAYNGDFTITVVDANTFTYTLAAATTSPATGTITAAKHPSFTFVENVTPPLEVATALNGSSSSSRPAAAFAASTTTPATSNPLAVNRLDGYFANSTGHDNGHVRTLAGALAKLHLNGDWLGEVF
jgi:hypothetical protein